MVGEVICDIRCNSRLVEGDGLRPIKDPSESTGNGHHDVYTS